MFCRCELEYGAAQNTHTCPVCLAHPGALPVPNGRGDRDDDRRSASRSAARSPSAPSSRARTTSIPTCRRATRSPSTTSRSAGRAASSCPTADGDREIGIVRAHLEEDAAKTVHVGGATGRIGRRRLLARRLQPRRHAAARDRHAARHPLGRRGDALPPAPAADDRRARHLRRGDGEGHAARRRQRLGAQARGGGLPAALGDQEHELVHVHRRAGSRRRTAQQIAALRGGRTSSSSRRTTTTPTPTG